MRDTDDKRLAIKLLSLWGVGTLFMSVIVVIGYISLYSDGEWLRYLALTVFASGIPMYWATMRLANFYEGPSHHKNKLGHALVYMVYILPLIWLAREVYLGDGGDPGAIKTLLLFAMLVGIIMFGFAIIDRHRYLDHRQRGLL